MHETVVHNNPADQQLSYVPSPELRQQIQPPRLNRKQRRRLVALARKKSSKPAR